MKQTEIMQKIQHFCKKRQGAVIRAGAFIKIYVMKLEVSVQSYSLLTDAREHKSHNMLLGFYNYAPAGT